MLINNFLTSSYMKYYLPYRWMLLGFKRELSAEDSMKCFEILSSHHLELSSHEAEKLRQAQQRKNFQLKGLRNLNIIFYFKFCYE